MSRHLERLLKIDDLLRSERRCTAVSLGELLEVSERTIRADIAFLRDRYHAPLKFSRKLGFHYTDPDWRLPTISLSRGELFALTVGARMLEAYSGSVYTQELRSAIARLSERLPEQSWIDMGQLAEDHILFRSGAEVDLNPEVWHQLEDACRQQRTVLMTYYTASRNAESERQFDPYLLHIYRGTNPYVIGYCHRRQEVRWFRVDRIRRLSVLTEEFVRRPDFKAKDHLEMIFRHEVGGGRRSVVVWFDAPTAPYIRERRWHPTQKIQEHPDGSLTLNMVVSGLNDVKRWLLGYGKGAIALEPKELVALVKAELSGMVHGYQVSGLNGQGSYQEGGGE